MTTEGPLFHKPKSFLSARQTIYASIFTGVIATAIFVASVGIANAGGTPFFAATVAFYVIFFYRSVSHRAKLKAGYYSHIRND